MMILRALIVFLRGTDRWRLFTESDAWHLFEGAAIGEVIGWTLLIYGIAADTYGLPGRVFALPVGGSIHGVLFLSYLGVALATYSSLGWTRLKGIMAVMMSVIPYGTLVFSIWAARIRRAQQLQTYRRITVRAVIRRGQTVLAWQTIGSANWVLPGGEVQGNESVEGALGRIITALTGIAPQWQTTSIGEQSHDRLELIFELTNSADYRNIAPRELAKADPLIDECRFIAADEPFLTPELTHLIQMRPE